MTYVGLINDSLYALSHKHFPLVVFERERPAFADVCSGRHCLVGTRKSEHSRQWDVPLIEAAPNTVPQQRVPVSKQIGSGETLETETSTHPEEAKELGDQQGPSTRWGHISVAIVSVLVTLGVGFGVGAKRAALPLLPVSILPPEERALLPGSNESISKAPTVVDDVSPGAVDEPAVTTPALSVEAPPTEAMSPNATIMPVPLKLPSESPSERSRDPLSTLVEQPSAHPSLPTPPQENDNEDEETTDKEEATDKESTPMRRKGRRRKRGKKKGKGSGGAEDETEPVGAAEVKEMVENIVPPTPMPAQTPVAIAPTSSLIVSDTVLGFGSHGTMVFEGSFQGRAVAVKRLLRDFVTIAAREVSVLQDSDDHPNVVRYFYQESKDNFMYIALELCPASLADIVERPAAFPMIAATFDPKRALQQVTNGLRHLHSLKIVHRDIKPQNILVSGNKNGQHRMMISDFGLCKKLELDQTSFLPTMHGALAAGTVGWRAPEILRGDVKLDEEAAMMGDGSGSDDQSSRGSTASTATSGSTANGVVKPARLTRSVDVFALGCLFYYALTGGGHPYGDRFEREVNILRNQVCLDGLEHFGEEGSEAVNIISKMLEQDPKARPDTTTCLIHPFFWTPARRLNFLQDASDRFEIMCRDPREHALVVLETGAHDVVGNDWHSRLDRVFIENLGKFRKYDGKSVQDLMRALRNKKHHYQDIPDNVKRHLGDLPEGFLAYFTRRFPRLFLHVYEVVWKCGLETESMFRSYFELDNP